MVQLLRQSPGRTPWRNERLKLPIRRDRGFDPLPVADLIAHFDETGVVGNPITQWTNNIGGASEFDLNVIDGDGDLLRSFVPGDAFNTGRDGDFFTSTDVPVGQFTEDMDLQWIGTIFALPTGPASLTFVAADDDSIGGRGTAFFLQDNGSLFFAASTDGNVFDILAFSTANPTMTFGVKKGIRVTRSTITGDITFFESPGDLNWTQIGDVVPAVSGALFNANNFVTIGCQDQEGLVNNERVFIESITMSDAIGGATQVRFLPANASSPRADWTDDLTGANWASRGDSYINTASFPVVLCINNQVSILSTTIGAPVIPQPFTVLVAVQKTLAQQGRNVFDSLTGADRVRLYSEAAGLEYIQNAGNDVNAGFTPNPRSAYVVSLIYDGADSLLQLSGFGPVAGDAGANSWTFATIFGNAQLSIRWGGWMAEMAIYSDALGPTQLREAQNFLENKWL